MLRLLIRESRLACQKQHDDRPSGVDLHWVAGGVTDMRNGFQGLAAKVEATLRRTHSYVTQANMWRPKR